MITYMPAFGPAAYFGNIPSKFVANATTTDEKVRRPRRCPDSSVPGSLSVRLPRLLWLRRLTFGPVVSRCEKMTL